MGFESNLARPEHKADPFAAHSTGSAFDEALLEAEHPDLVLEVHLERQLTPDR